jgi:hypothetical protein
MATKTYTGEYAVSNFEAVVERPGIRYAGGVLTVFLVLLAITVIPFALGLFLGLLVTLTPGIERKVKLTRAIATACCVFADEPERIWRTKEAEWLVRRRYPDKVPSEVYDRLLQRLKKD